MAKGAPPPEGRRSDWSNILTKTCKNPVTALFSLDDNRQMIGADRWNALKMIGAGGVTGICHPSTPGVKEHRSLIG